MAQMKKQISADKQSPLFWPVFFKNKTIYVLDETALPRRLKYLRAKSAASAIRMIKEMRTRAFGQVLISYYIFLLVLGRNKKLKGARLIKILRSTAREINQARPTFAFNVFTSMVLGWAENARAQNKDIVTSVTQNISGFLAHMRRQRLERAQRAARLIKDGDTILTHCNVSGEMVAIGRACRKKKKRVKFIASETRPYLQGSRLTAWELHRDGFEVRLITDNMVGYCMSAGLVDKVIVGADRFCSDGAIINKIGTYQLAILARRHGIPFYALTQREPHPRKSSQIKIEQRPDKEMLMVNKQRIAPYGVKGFYPAFDITPKELISRTIELEVK